MIRCQCRTNLDSAAHEQWPTMFPSVPRVGETVYSAGGRPLRVIGVSYNAPGMRRLAGDHVVVEIELHLMPGQTLLDDIAAHRSR